MAPQEINWEIYHSLPLEQAQYQLAHVSERQTKEIAATYSICLPLALVAILMRFVSRRIGRSSYGADDWMIIVAMIITAGYAASALLTTFRYGGGRHTILMTETDPDNFGKSLLAAEVLYSPAIGAVKISTLLLFGRIFPGRKFRNVLWSIGIFVFIYTSVSVFAEIFQCRPIRGVWDITINADCIQLKIIAMFMGGSNVLTDLLILCAPLPQLWKLQMPKNTKYQIIAIFGIGGFTTVTSIYRIPKVNAVSRVDPGWSDCGASIWNMIEISVAIVCASAITYRPLFNWIFRIRSLTSNSRRRKSRPSDAAFQRAGSVFAGFKSIKGSDIGMQPLADSHQPNLSTVHSKSRGLESGDVFFRIDDGIDV